MHPNNKRGKQSFVLPNKPVITHWASVAGKKESQGPLAKHFDYTSQDTYFAQKTWEQAEKRMQQLALEILAKKVGIQKEDFPLVYSGDLLNQCIGSSFSLNNCGIPHLGLYGACSTMSESLLLAAMTVEGGFSDQVVAMTSSHFASSERQYRFPLGYGGQRTPSAQWTVTGSGSVVLSKNGNGPYVTHITTGKIIDMGIKDANNMGAAMAPAAADTLKAHFSDTTLKQSDYDMILTGDLGTLGKDILIDLMMHEGIDLRDNYDDCGCLIFDAKTQDTHAGGSGCGCGAVTLTGFVLNLMRVKKINNVLFMATGALLSPTSTLQGESIPAVAHAISISNNISFGG